MERDRGIEPLYSAWKADAQATMPIPHVSGLAEASAGLAENHIVYPDENFKRLAPAAGFEPATS